MMRRTLEFFRREKKYTILFLLLVLTYGAIAGANLSRPAGSPEISADTLEKLKQAETRFMRGMESGEGGAAATEEAEGLFGFLLQLAFLLFLAGLLVQGLFIFSRRRRQALQVVAPAEAVEWRFSMLFKAVLLFLSAAMAIQWGAALLHHFFFREMISLNLLLLFQTTIVDIMCFSFLVYIVGSHGGTWRSLGLRIPSGRPLREILIGAAGYMAVFPVFIVLLGLLVFLANSIAWEPPAHPLVHILLEEEKRSPFTVFYSVFLATVIAPVLEEIFFRGFCYPIFRSQWGAGRAMLLSALFFALIHENLFAFAPIMVLGLALAYTYEKRRSLLAPIVLHWMHNSVFLFYFFMAKHILNT